MKRIEAKVVDDLRVGDCLDYRLSRKLNEHDTVPSLAQEAIFWRTIWGILDTIQEELWLD